jgi:pantoate--beta-alanine ligase
MEIVNRVQRMSSICTKALSNDMKVGLVSTMGAIHPGHLSLIQTARKMTDLVVVSIFVDRLQFMTAEEYQSYPRDITKDVDLLRHENVDYIFTPPEEEMYPAGFSTYVCVENYGEKVPVLYGSTYFRGMTTSVTKMIHIVKAAFIFLGQKDGLQGSVLRKMMRDLNINTEVVVTPVVRDASGLPYAARNYFLKEEEMAAAAVIYRSLKAAEDAIAAGEVQSKRILKDVAQVMETEPLARLEYVVIANPDTLEPVNKIEGKTLIAIGAVIGTTPLNDSLLLELPPK